MSPTSGTDRTRDVWGPRTPYGAGTAWPERRDEFLVDGVSGDQVERWVASACLLCSNGCGIDIAVAGDRMVGVRGRTSDRVNHGRLGPKGLYGWQGQQHDRLLHPLVRRGGALEPATWDEAMGLVVERSQDLLAQKGPLSHGFYTSGQLMLEEYYTLAVVGKAGIGTPHMDGNTRLCTATAAAALKESFGADGQPGSYTDVDHCDALFLYGHNVAETQTVLWSRMLDRLDGPDPPALVCVDPRRTSVAARADVHLALRPGTNLALMSGLVHLLLAKGWIDEEYVAAHTRGLADLQRVVADYPPGRVEQVCGVAVRDLEEAAELFGTRDRVLSTVLQGFYQSHQATAASVQVNNLHLLRGMLGRPGAGVLQMNGQPTAQNARQTGADGDLPGFRNWENPDHVQQLADLWDVDASVIPDWAPPTHAMQIFRYVEQGSIGFLWIAGTNPAVSLPELGRIREVLSADSVFTVVTDAWLTETAELADVVLPAALWGEKAGTYTNADRTVHLSQQAVEPPGEARTDLDIWVDYARRLGLRDRSGRPIPRWNSPEAAFDAWRACTRGRPCDYSGMSWDLLRDGGGVQWPCTEESPDGTERLYVDGSFSTADETAETYGHDLATGGTVTPEQHRALRLDGRAWLRGADWFPDPGQPTEDHPFALNTGRTVHHFHTRTKTGRAPQLQAAAPTPWAELCREDADRLGIVEGDLVRVTSARGSVEVPLRIRDLRPGTVFLPFHYGDVDAPPGHHRAANELTLTAWDPVSKQPVFKSGAVAVAPVSGTTTGDREEA